MTDYEISRSGGQCHVTGRAFEVGETFHSALFETPDGVERRDYCADAWDGPPADSFCHFQTRVPKRDEPTRTFVDDDTLVRVFAQFADADAPNKLRFRFVLSLILMRKRLLKYESTERTPEGEYWQMRLMRDKSLHTVFNPSLSEPEIEAAADELRVVLSDRLLEDIDENEKQASAESNGANNADNANNTAEASTGESAETVASTPSGESQD